MDTFELKEFKLWNIDYDEHRGKSNLNYLEIYGICYLFAQWLQENLDNYQLETAIDVYDNTSVLRDGNRLDIFDSYYLTSDRRYRIKFLWVSENKKSYASVYDAKQNIFIGSIKISN